MKRRFSILIAGLMAVNTFYTPILIQAEDKGNIDLYQVFSNKQDQMKTEVGSRIFKWSMHLPEDAFIYKSDRANFFNMQTESYKSNISLEVTKNKKESSIKEIYYALQSGKESSYGFYLGFGDKEFISDIETDEKGREYIRIVKTEEFYDYYLLEEAVEDFNSYIENRIYLSNNYIYNLQVQMEGQYYREHPQKFKKLISSFDLNFDEKNPYIKELSDTVSTARIHENKSYGWKMSMQPYWKMEGAPNARTQKFIPVYTDEEILGIKQKEEQEESMTSLEDIVVTLISSANIGETAESWAKEELDDINRKFNKEVFEVLKQRKEKLDGIDAFRQTIRYKMIPKKPYVEEKLYVIGNGYKYLVAANIPDEKYKDVNMQKTFEDMILSFRLTNQRSKYLGKILNVKDLTPKDEQKEIKTKKYNFKTKVPKVWSISGQDDYMYNMYDMYYNEKYYYSPYEFVSNQEQISAYDSDTNINMFMMVGLNTQDMEEIIKNRANMLLSNDEVRTSLAQVKIEKTNINGIILYRFTKEYDMESIKSFMKEDETKTYDYSALCNEYSYIFKINNDVYEQTVTIPLANMNENNKKIADSIWKNTEASNVNYSGKVKKWNVIKNETFLEEKK